MEINIKEKSSEEIAKSYTTVLEKVKNKVRECLEIKKKRLVDCMKESDTHADFFYGLLARERRKKSTLEYTLKTLKYKLTQYHMSKNAPIRAKTKTEAEEMARCDGRFRTMQVEYFWMCELVDYLEGVTNIFKNRNYNLGNIKDLELKDPTLKLYKNPEGNYEAN